MSIELYTATGTLISEHDDVSQAQTAAAMREPVGTSIWWDHVAPNEWDGSVDGSHRYTIIRSP
jgi:hypothetical protein